MLFIPAWVFVAKLSNSLNVHPEGSGCLNDGISIMWNILQLFTNETYRFENHLKHW